MIPIISSAANSIPVFNFGLCLYYQAKAFNNSKYCIIIAVTVVKFVISITTTITPFDRGYFNRQ